MQTWFRLGTVAGRRALPTAFALALSACATTPDATGRADAPGAPQTEARVVSAGARLDALGQHLATLEIDVRVQGERLDQALSAVNWRLMREPRCVDALFADTAALYLSREALADESDALSSEHARLLADRAQGTLSLEALVSLENRTSKARDDMMFQGAKLAEIFATVTRPGPACAPKPSPEAVDL